MRCGSSLELLGDRVVGAGRVGDVEPALLVEVGDDGPIDQRRPGGQLDLEAVGQGEGVAVELDRVRLRDGGTGRRPESGQRQQPPPPGSGIA